MPKVISVNIKSTDSINKAIREVDKYRRQIEKKTKLLCERLAAMGAISVSLGFSQAFYDGPTDFAVSIESESNNIFRVTASGDTVAFVEFGAGITYAADGAHPKNGEFGTGPGTYPEGKGHWNDPKGWWLPKEKGGGKSWGNPAQMPIYRTAQELAREVARVAAEVFSRD